MNSELKAILRRRRRRSDGVPPSPESERRSSSASSESPGPVNSQAIRDFLLAPPPPPPPGLPPKRKTGSSTASIQNRRREEENKSEATIAVAIDPPLDPSPVATQPVSPRLSLMRSPLSSDSETEIEVANVSRPSLESLPSATDSAKDPEEESSSEEGATTPASASLEVEEVEVDSRDSIEQSPVVEYEPPPAFELPPFIPPPKREEDRTPLESPPKRQKPTVSLRSWPLLQQSALRPAVNPLTGNVIVCFQKGSTVLLHEFDPKSHAVVVSVPLVSRGISQKMSALQKESISNVSSVVSLAAGIHRGHRRTRVRVAALVDYNMVYSDKETFTNRLNRALVIWQWGYAGPQGVAVQAIISPPPKSSGHDYSPESLLVADGLCFFSGTSAKSPCIYIAKTAHNAWAPIVVGSSPHKITATAVASTKDSFLALGLSDGSIGVWDYGPAIAAKRVGNSKSTKQLLLPLFQMEAKSGPGTLGETILWSTESSDTKHTSENESKDPGCCNHLEWTTPEPLGGPSLLMLAAAYTHGVAVFHTSLPSLTSAKHTVSLEPFAAARMSRVGYQNTSVVWIHLGPQSDPCLAVLNDGDTHAKIALCMIRLSRGRTASEETQRCHIRLLCESDFPSVPPASQKHMPAGLISLNTIGSIAYHCHGKVVGLSPALSSSLALPARDDPFFSSLRNPVASEPSGLDSTGLVMLPDSATDKDGILFVFTLVQCRSRERSGSASSGEACWMAPVQRHFLCRARIGDAKDLRDEPGQDRASGGSSTSIVCELRCDANSSSSSFVPHRIVRSKCTGHCAVLFRSAYSDKDSVPTSVTVDPSVVVILDSDSANGTPLVYQRSGRDVVFLSNGHDGSGRALCLSEDGSAIQLLTRQSYDVTESGWEAGPRFRPFLGVPMITEYSECVHLFVLSSGSWNGLLLVGTRVSDGQTFLACGPLIDPIDSQTEGWTNMLPNLKTDPVLWLEHGEEMIALSELPRYENGRRCIVVATQRRVFLAASDTLEVLSEMAVKLGCGSLASLGSHTVAFCSTDFKVRYLCGLQGKYSNGILAALPSPAYGSACFVLLAVHPDRIVYASACTGVRLVQEGENNNMFLSPTCITKPALLLQPLVANALCERSNKKYSIELIRVAIEKFGRKVKSLSHADDEGTGNFGSGLTPVVFEMLSVHGFKHPASWLLTGSTTTYERKSNCKILPAWAPMHAKAHAALNSDVLMQILANGDQYFSDYVRSPDQNMASNLPRSSDPSAELALEYARRAMVDGKIEGGLKLLDLAGTESSNSELLHLVLSLQLDPFSDVNKILKTMSGIGEKANAQVLSCNGATTSIAALMLELRIGNLDPREASKEDSDSRMSSDVGRRVMRQLAPSVQRGHRFPRARHRLIGESASEIALTGHKGSKEPEHDIWESPFNESNHIWNEGPFKEKQNLMALDRMEEWLGRSEPSILGKDGAAAALDRGEKTLADILSKAYDYDDDAFGGDSEGSENVRAGWVEGIGEGRTEEENLSAYFRMSEGGDEDSLWRTEGLADLTKFQHKAIVGGNLSSISLQPTTSSVDEGAPGKVKGVYDLVFEKECASGSPSGVAIEVVRGGSLDVGILHDPGQDMRKRCSIEFWYHVPECKKVSEEIILVRRAVKMHEDDIWKSCVASDRDNMLWELVVLPSGELEFRTSGGSSLSSSDRGLATAKMTEKGEDFRGGVNDVSESKGLVSWQRQDGGGGWNHVCLVLSSREHSDPSACTVSIIMKGEAVSSGVTTILPPTVALENLTDSSLVNEVMEKTVLAFCLSPVQGLRFTELRVWSCERSEEDCKMMMYEYLQMAEMKRKLKVNIRSKRRVLSSPTPSAKARSGLLAPPPRESDQRGRTRRGLISLPETRVCRDETVGDDVVVPFLGGQTKVFHSLSKVNERDDKGGSDQVCSIEEKHQSAVEESAKDNKVGANPASSAAFPPGGVTTISSPNTPASRYWDSALPLSAFVRRSAAAALIRGPPATRHFGGNRGGLAKDSRSSRGGKKRIGVGAIAICGAEKTVVYSHEQTPAGKTYPIGASGAVISDEMDSDGSEYLCCFLAKDKRMVVFEIKRKQVVVELQMTTKLNFWRYLPPQAHGHSLVFMLVTPVGGFHWSPLDDAPRPKQVWRRGPDLQGKKIISYEEGGSNGLVGSGARSSVALLLASVSTTTPVEAWIMPICGENSAFCVSCDVMGAALCRPSSVHEDEFLPFVVTAKRDVEEACIAIEIACLADDSSNEGLGTGEVLANVQLDVSKFEDSEFAAPPLAMGQWPEMICCCCENMVVAALRRKGLVAVYEFTGDSLELAFYESVGHYVVDAAVHSSNGPNSKIEVVLLLCDNDSPKDGRVVSISL